MNNEEQLIKELKDYQSLLMIEEGRIRVSSNVEDINSVKRKVLELKGRIQVVEDNLISIED